jgi:hypothetical protein
LERTGRTTSRISFHADGTVFRSVPGEASIDPARPPHTPTHGVWRYLGKGRFGVTMWDIFSINTGQLLHYMKIRLEVTLDDDRDEASARAILEVLDPQGVVLQSRTGTISFVRIPFEPLESAAILTGSVARARGICPSSHRPGPYRGARAGASAF